MGNIVKIKIGLSIMALSIMILIPLLKSKFNAPVTIKRWTRLTWDDFQGLPMIFNEADALISCKVYLEYDSNKMSFHAFAGQNNIGSWRKPNTTNVKYSDEYLLDHEQYHFNIAEIHARFLNEYIEKNPTETEDTYFFKLQSINSDLGEMQKQYDDETDHSLILSRQIYWEFKIDSMLELTSGWTTDDFSGAMIYFPGIPSLKKGATASQANYRKFGWEKYLMFFQLTSIQSESFNDNTISQTIRALIKDSDTIKTLTVSKRTALIVLSNSSHEIKHFFLSYNGDYLFSAEVTHFNNPIDTSGFYQVARSYIRSFRIINTDSIWIDQLSTSTDQRLIDNKSNFKESSSNLSYCIPVDSSLAQGFYRKPILTQQGLLLPFDPLLADSIRDRDILRLDNASYDYVPSPKRQFFLIPKNKIPQLPFKLEFGYVLKADSAKGCHTFYRQSLMVD